MSKKSLVRLSWLAHLLVAIILCDFTPSILERILLLVSIGAIFGVQKNCIKNIQFPEDSETEQ